MASDKPSGETITVRQQRSPGSMRDKPIIGLVGSIGAGKSTVASVLGSLGAGVIDSDREAHRELASPEVAATLADWWGEAVAPGGRVDRAAVARIVFRDAAELRRLESLLYPRMARRRGEVIERWMADPTIRAVVLDSPKLYEAGLDRDCDAVICVDAPREVRLARLAAARGWNAAELDRRENSQISLDEKKKKADYIVSNNSSAEALPALVEKVLEDILDRFARRPVS